MKRSLLFCTLILTSLIAYAEHSAPVFDVDSMSNDSQTVNASAQDENAKSALNQALTTSTEPPATVEQRVERMEQLLASLQQTDLSNRLNGMQGEVQALRGQVEELTHQLQEFRSQQRLRTEAEKASGRDLADQQAMSPVPRDSDEDGVSSSKLTSNKKMQAKPEASLEKQSGTLAENRASAPSVKKTSPSYEQPNTVEEQSVYQTAYNLIKMKKYDEAIGILQKMLVKYPSGQSAANAHYWLGELYSLTGANERAASEFSVVVKQYPSNPRVADAELKLGLINATLLKWPAAKASFKKVISQYPGTTSARLAMEQLKLLKQSGH